MRGTAMTFANQPAQRVRQAIDPDEARRRAKEVLAHAQLGKDPQADKAEAKARAARTLGAEVERYLDRHAAGRLKPKTLADVKRYLRHHWRPLHPLPLHKVQRRHAAAYLAEIAAARRTPSTSGAA